MRSKISCNAVCVCARARVRFGVFVHFVQQKFASVSLSAVLIMYRVLLLLFFYLLLHLYVFALGGSICAYVYPLTSPYLHCRLSQRHQVRREAMHCPLCKVVIAPFPGEDPNVAMSQHIDSGCSNPDDWKKDARFKCSKPKCKKRSVMQIVCPTCKQTYCPAHRHESSHDCPGDD